LNCGRCAVRRAERRTAKETDQTLQKAHDYCQPLRQQLKKYKFSTPAGAGTKNSTGIQPVNKLSEQDKKSPRSCKFCGYKHAFTKPSRCPAFGKLCLKCTQKGHFAQVCPAKCQKGLPRGCNATHPEFKSGSANVF